MVFRIFHFSSNFFPENRPSQKLLYATGRGPLGVKHIQKELKYLQRFLGYSQKFSIFFPSQRGKKWGRGKKMVAENFFFGCIARFRNFALYLDCLSPHKNISTETYPIGTHNTMVRAQKEKVCFSAEK